jgi:S1-C subfamily serine protease
MRPLRRLWFALSMIALPALLTGMLTGCGAALEQLARHTSTSAPVAAPDPVLSQDAVVTMVRPSVVRVRTLAPGCQKVLEGSGFVVAPNKVLTAGHVVAGGDTFTVDVDGSVYDARVVSYDSNADVAIMDVPALSAQSLAFTDVPASTGTEALVMGYPGGGSFVVTPVRIIDRIQLDGPDIYRTTTTSREVYIIGGGPDRIVSQGVSGGPLVDMTGHVLGMAFGAETDKPTTGFALSAAQVAPQLATIGTAVQVGTGSCVS